MLKAREIVADIVSEIELKKTLITTFRENTNSPTGETSGKNASLLSLKSNKDNRGIPRNEGDRWNKIVDHHQEGTLALG